MRENRRIDLTKLHYEVLDENDAITIDGERYKKVERNAKVGERILIVTAEDTYGKYSDGDVFIVDEVLVDLGVCVNEAKTDGDEDYNPEGYITHREYVVLEPIEESPKSVEDMLVHLSQEVAKLKRELSDLRADMAKRADVEKFAETASNAELIAKKALGEAHSLAHDVEALKRRLSDDDLAELGAEIVHVVLRHLEREGRVIE